MTSQIASSPNLYARSLVVRLDGEGRFLEANDAYCKMFGRTEKELLGQWYMPLVHEEDKEHTEKQMHRLWDPPYACDLENRAMTVNGWRWLTWHAQAKVDDKGHVKEVHAFGEDITETKWPPPNARKKLETLSLLLDDVTAEAGANSATADKLRAAKKLVEDLHHPKQG